MSPVKLLLVALAVAVGVAAVVAGGADDSPGLQMLGLVVAVGAVVYGVRTRRARKQDPSPPPTS
jgi:peptidoglycan/LPS O-acetylase OafA/YrhL